MKKQSKDPVKLRMRTTRTGLISLYLDIYYNGQRKYEYLHLYLTQEHTQAEKQKNKEIKQLAEAIRAKRIVEIRNHQFGFADDYSDIDYLTYFCTLCGKKKRGTWTAVSYLLKDFIKKPIPISKIDADWIKRWLNYLNDIPHLENNSRWTYHAKIIASFNQAIKDGIINTNPCKRVDSGLRLINTERQFLTIDELRQLSLTSNLELWQRAFLFSCLTGMRASDINALRWGQVHKQGDMTRIIFRQRKTKRQEYLDINKQAADLMGERHPDKDLVFGDDVNTSYNIRKIRAWAASKGINKPLTFHSARHTFAVMMLDIGVDIYTTSKLLGHTSVQTTQIYAKVLDKNKQAAVKKIPKLF